MAQNERLFIGSLEMELTSHEVNSADFGISGIATATTERFDQEVEQRILRGENCFEMQLPGGGTIRYEVPLWHKHPIWRFRVELARWSHRRARNV